MKREYSALGVMSFEERAVLAVFGATAFGWVFRKDLVLGILTVFEVYVPTVWSAEWNKTTKMLLLVILAVSKALLVGLYFMHLKWEKPWLKWIALMPAYMAIATILLMLEVVYR